MTIITPARQAAQPRAAAGRGTAADREAGPGEGHDSAGGPRPGVGPALAIGTLLAAGTAPGPVPAKRDAEWAVTTLYGTHYRSLVRLAALLVQDMATAEQVVQDSFVAMHASWPRLRGTGKALSYLRQSVVNRSRSALRHRAVAGTNPPQPSPTAPSAGQETIAGLLRSEVVSALRKLPVRQREALVLRYYCDLTDAQIASTMGISRTAVKTHMARGMSSLRTVLELTP